MAGWLKKKKKKRIPTEYNIDKSILCIAHFGSGAAGVHLSRQSRSRSTQYDRRRPGLI